MQVQNNKIWRWCWLDLKRFLILQTTNWTFVHIFLNCRLSSACTVLINLFASYLYHIRTPSSYKPVQSCCVLQIYNATLSYNTIRVWSRGCSISHNVCLKLMTPSHLNSAKWICGLSYTRWLGLNVGLYVQPAAMTWLIHNAIRLHHLVLFSRSDVRRHRHKLKQLTVPV